MSAAVPKGPMVRLSQNYQSREPPSEGVSHGIPVGVASIRRALKDCKSSCATCAKDCTFCPLCPLKKIESKSLMTVFAYQKDGTPLTETAYVLLGDKAIAMTGGVCIVFNPTQMPFGLWKDGHGVKYPWRCLEVVEFQQ